MAKEIFSLLKNVLPALGRQFMTLFSIDSQSVSDFNIIIDFFFFCLCASVCEGWGRGCIHLS